MSNPVIMRSLIAAQDLSAWNGRARSLRPSKDKAVLFFEVEDLGSAVVAVGGENVVHAEPAWAVLHDPEGYNVLLLERATRKRLLHCVPNRTDTNFETPGSCMVTP
jgi:hypothetical protein